jgi:hypothetical protein
MTHEIVLGPGQGMAQATVAAPAKPARQRYRSHPRQILISHSTTTKITTKHNVATSSS